jgi:hypothetical protein
MRRSTKVAAIAFADGIVRMAWAMMAKGECELNGYDALAAHAQPTQSYSALVAILAVAIAIS